MKNCSNEIVLSILLFILIIGCSANIAQKQVIDKMAPGTVDVLATFSRVTDEGNHTIVELKIDKINSYGPASSPVAVNSTVTALVLLSDMKDSFRTMPIDTSVNVILKLNQDGVNVKDSYKWEIIRIIKNN